MRARLLVLVVLCCAGAAGGDPRGPTTVTAPAGRAEKLLAAESLRHSAICLAHSPPDTPARAARLVVLGHFARRLAPNDPLTNLLFANVIYQTQGRFAPGARAARAYLTSYPEDHEQGVLWLRLTLEGMNTAEQKVSFLSSVIDRKDLPDALRAQAASELGQVYLGQGKREETVAVFRRGLELDPYNPGALNGLLALKEDPAPHERVRTVLGLIRSNPMAVALGWELGVQLDALGLPAESLEFFRHPWEVTTRRAPLDQIPHDFAAHYLNAMLSAGRYREAIEMFTPICRKFPQSVDLHSLLGEAYRAVGDAKKAEQQIREIRSIYQQRDSPGKDTSVPPAEWAMFYLVSTPDAEKALRYANQAAKLDPTHPVVQRILGVAELASAREGFVQGGLRRLEKLVDKDVYAAVFVGEHYYSKGNAGSGKRVILAGASVSRSGPAYRRLARLAEKHNVTIPPAQGAEKVLESLRAFDRRYLRMGVHPEEFISVSIRGLKERLLPGEPLEIEATLTNKSTVDVPMGGWGLFRPVMGVQVRVSGVKEPFTKLPAAVWAAPRYLAPGREVRCKVRLDVGSLQVLLTRRPLEELLLTVSGMLDPIQRKDGFHSGLPTVKIKPVTLRRVSLLGKVIEATPDALPHAYRQVLEHIDAVIRNGKLPARMLAGRQVASLLGMYNERRSGEAQLPESLEKTVSADRITTMLKSLLEDRSWAVRAEVIAALGCASLDEVTLPLVKAAANDPNPLVRLRAAELLGASNSPSCAELLQRLSRDPDELVRLMAAAFRKSK